MLDTIGLYHQDRTAFNSCKYLNNVSEVTNTKTGEVILYGNLENLKIKLSGDSLSIKGSLPKYLYGDNVSNLTRKGVQVALESLSDGLHLNIDTSRLYRIDIASNFIMSQPVTTYLNCLESLSRHQKITYKDSIYFRTATKTLAFYDKVKELKRKKQVIPDTLKGKNILRYELQLTKRIPAIFKQIVFAKDLYQENFYIKAVDIWRELYFSIEKNRILDFNTKVVNMLNSKTMVTELALIGLEQLGKDELLSILARNKDRFSKTKYYRIRKKIIELSKLPELTEVRDNIKELNGKVEKRIKYYR